jgi:hypothetical protein
MTPQSSDALRRTIREVRWRYRLRVALRGAAICLLAALLTFVVSAFGLDQFRYSPWAIASFRIFAYAAVLGLLLRFLVVPLAGKVGDERIALYVEEHEPSLDAALVSAVESEPRAKQGRPDLSPELVRRLVETAIEQVERIDYGRLVERPRLNRFGAMLAGAAGVGMLLALLSPAFVRQAAPFLLKPWSVRAASPYAIDVLPGNAQVARGSDQIVSAQLKGFDSDKVELAAKAGSSEWKRQQMVAEPGSGEYRFMLLALGQPTEYFVESSGVRSSVFRIDVVDKPYVKTLDLEYTFPRYTGLQPQKVEDGGDVAALKGTEVGLKVTPTFRVGGGRLLVEGEAPAELSLQADGTLTGRFTVAKDGFYKIELHGGDGRPQPASPDYAITVLKDQPPSVAFVKPGRDSKVTPIEEVFAEVKAEDDFGVANLELVYSVNGGEEKTLALHKGAPRKFVSAGHTFFLEELGLSPGDFVSYYARVKDAGAPAQAAATDIYFLEARPFRRDYRQAEQGGMPGGGGGQQEGALSQQQRQVIAATFKLQRDRQRLGEKSFAEDLRTVALVQARLREQVEGLVSRMGARGILEPGSDFQQTASELRLAAAEMKTAEEGLEKKQPKDALPPEQRALSHLQKAEGAFRDVQVAFGGGGGGGGGAQAEELADLFELELDKLRNQYETVQRGAQEQADQQVDEAMQRLQELARRQEQENERMRQRAGRLPNQSGGGSGSQRSLADETEELGRKLERLAREKASTSLEETARRLREAADSMRRSAANTKGGASADGQAALDRLKDARRLLDTQRQARLDRDIKEAQQKAEELRQSQERIASDTRELQGGAGASGDAAEKKARLMQRKDALASGVGELESQLDKMSQESRREQKDASRKLQETANSIRDQKLKEKIRYSKGFLNGGSPEVGQQFERDISGQLSDLEKRLREAAGAVGQSEDQKKAAALDKARNLVRNMESLEERLRSAGSREQGGGQEQGQQQGGREGREGQPQGGSEQGREQGQSSGQQQGGQQAGGQQSGGQQRGGQQGGEQQGGDQQGGQRGGGQQAGGRSGGPAGPDQTGGMLDGGRDRNGLSPGGRPRFLTSEEARQLGRELRARAADAQELQRELQRGGLPAQDAEEIARRIRNLENKSLGDPLGLAKLASEVVEDLKMLEYSLRRAAEGDKPKLYLSGSEELPPGYKALVEEYYRSLARKQK